MQTPYRYVKSWECAKWRFPSENKRVISFYELLGEIHYILSIDICIWGSTWPQCFVLQKQPAFSRVFARFKVWNRGVNMLVLLMISTIRCFRQTLVMGDLLVVHHYLQARWVVVNGGEWWWMVVDGGEEFFWGR